MTTTSEYKFYFPIHSQRNGATMEAGGGKVGTKEEKRDVQLSKLYQLPNFKGSITWHFDYN